MNKLKLLAAAATGMVALAAPAFSAISVADLQGSTGAVVVWHAGASASTPAVQEAVVSSLCDSTLTVNLYGNNADITKADLWTVECSSSAAAGLATTGTKIIYSKRDKNGSGVGVGPILSGQAVGFMNPVSNTSTAKNCPNTLVSVPKVVGTTTVNYFNCTGLNYGVAGTTSLALASLTEAVDLVLAPLSWGTSDIEPSKFAFPLNAPTVDLNGDGTPDAISATVNTLTATPLAYLIFNTPVNVLMYQDLQRAQFPSGHPDFNDCNPAGANYGNINSTVTPTATQQANSAKCMPGLSLSQLRSIFMSSGQIRSIGDMQKESGYHTGTMTAMTGTGTTSTVIHICRRGQGSGTQASFNANIMGYPCDFASDWLTPEVPNAVLAPGVHNGSDATAVENCLNDFNNGANASGFNAALAKAWAIGVQSTDKNAPDTTTNTYTNSYRFIRIDDAQPTLANVHAGEYVHFAQQSINYPNAKPAGDLGKVFDDIVSAFTSPTKLANLDQTHPWGVTAWIAAPSATNLPTAVLSFTSPISRFQKVSSGGKGNTCAPPSAYKAPGVPVTVSPRVCSNDAGGAAPFQNCYSATGL
jgi:hypothetical protein